MSLSFSGQEIMTIYLHFIQKLRELEFQKSQPDNLEHLEHINQQIKQYSAVIEKIEKTYPRISDAQKFL